MSFETNDTFDDIFGSTWPPKPDGTGDGPNQGEMDTLADEAPAPLSETLPDGAEETRLRMIDGSEKRHFTAAERASVMDQIFARLEVYLSGRHEKAARRILAHMKKGGKMWYFNCRIDMMDLNMSELSRAGVPYVLLTEKSGRMGFLFRDTDLAKVRRAQKTALKLASLPCQTMTGDAVRYAYVQAKAKDKALLQVGGFDRDEVRYLEKLCGHIFYGGAIGVDKMRDGTYLFTCHAMSGMKGYAGKTVPLSIAESVVLLNGTCGDDMRRDLAAEDAFWAAREAGFPNRAGGHENPVWIVGRGMNFIEVRADKFISGHALEIGEEIILSADHTVPKSQEDYSRRLDTALGGIPDHICLYTERDVIDHFLSRRKYGHDKEADAEKAFLTAADRVVTGKISRDSVMHHEGRYRDKLRHYQKNMARVLRAVRDGKVPRGYTAEDIGKLRRTAGRLGVSLRDLTPAISRLLSLDVYEREAELDRASDIRDVIDRATGRAGQVVERQERVHTIDEFEH